MSASPVKDIKVEGFRRRVIEWYEKHGDKHLPWRKTNDGWAVLVASLLLRKTTVAQVVNVYSQFLMKFPNPQSLLSASEDYVKSVIRPLGIEHQRAKHFKELAKILLERFGGKVPCDRQELKKLPGIGDYIASEILLRICGEPAPLLDRNMIRVIGRFFGVKSDKKRPHMDPELWSFAKELVPKNPEEAEKFNFGVLDFARKVCTVRTPHCTVCPAKDLCEAFRSNMHAQNVYLK
jgi:A/G-specific adenine glycosylase